jgi:hypothetical protein
MLLTRFGRAAVSEMRFVAIPRGGLLVLGMLSYVLGLRREQLMPSEAPLASGAPDSPPSGPPIVVVDDCSLTGLRFGEFLNGHPELRNRGVDSVVFAHLYSHPELRSAIEDGDERVVTALAAHDLRDHAPEILGSDHAEWQDGWMKRSGKQCYWVGRPDRLAFPWTEPDLTVWNPDREREEPGWRIIPPERCLKNRFASREGSGRIQVQPPGIGPVRPASGTYFARLGDAVIAANLGTGKVVRLDGIGGEIWMGLMQGDSPEAVAASLSAHYAVERKQARGDIEELLQDLVRLGLVTVPPSDVDDPDAPASHGE